MAKRRRTQAVHEVVNEQPLSAGSYAIVALISGLIGIALLVFYVREVPTLVQSGIQSQIFYILLFPWALACAAFLFGAMRSYARYRQKHLGSVLELGGPVVLFSLVLWGGFKLVPPLPTFFDLTVRAHSADDTVPRVTSGTVWIELDSVRRPASFDASGEANFKDVPSIFKGQFVRLLPEVEGYEEKWQRQKIYNNVLDIPLVCAPRPQLRLRGIIDPPPPDPKKVKITVDGQDGMAIPDDLGRFALLVDGRPGDRVRMKAYFRTQRIYDDYQTLPGPVTLVIHHQ